MHRQARGSKPNYSLESAMNVSGNKEGEMESDSQAESNEENMETSVDHDKLAGDWFRDMVMQYFCGQRGG